MFGLLKEKIGSFVKGLTSKSKEIKEPSESFEEEKKRETNEREVERISIPESVKGTVKEATPKSSTMPSTKPSINPTKPSTKPSTEIQSPPKISPMPSPQAPSNTPSNTLSSTSSKTLPSTSLRTSPKISPKINERKTSKSRLKPLRIGIGQRIKSIITGKVRITKKEVDPLLEELEMSLLEGDVAFDVAEKIIEDLRKRFNDIEVDKNELDAFIKNSIKGTLIDILSSDRQFKLIDRIVGLVDEKKQGGPEKNPVKILFIGPNGAGKTTTIAKIAHLLMKRGISVMFSASDTFRAAAVEQLNEHARKLNVPILKGKYGSDPTSIAYDAINYAKAHRIDVVLIDTAGRQDTSRNLLDQLSKMQRVIKPDLKIYVGESIVGNAIIEQINSFNKVVALDGVILTKLDCDAKGGSSLSITYTTGIPILMIGVGQGYDDLIDFVPEDIVDKIVG